VELPKHQLGSYEVSSHGHYRLQKRQQKTRGRDYSHENLAEVEQLCQSQEDKPGTHNSQRQAARIINGMSRGSVKRVLRGAVSIHSRECEHQQ